MKRLLILILPFLTYKANAEENITRIKSEIKEVTVFLHGAQITNTGSSSLKTGMNQLVFENLSPNININSLQAKGEGDFSILSVVHKTNYLSQQPKTKDLIGLEDSLDALQNKIELQKGLRSVYEHEEAMLLANKSIGGQNNGVTSAELEKVANVLRTRLIDLKNKQLEIKQREKKLNESISKINQQLNEINNKRNQPTGEIIVMVLAKTNTIAKVSVTYQISDAGWSPSYDIRATDSNSPIDLTYRANVYQNSGVAWNKVKITLSTGNPALSGTKPQLNPWWLNFYTANSYKQNLRYDAAPSMAIPRMETKSGMVQELDKEKAGSAYDYVSATETQTNTEYEIGIPYDIPSDGKPYLVEIQHYSIPASYQYYCAPKLENDAFLLAKITGWDQYNLLSGEANIFFEGTYVGKSFLNTLSTTDTLDISLGRDKNVVVTRTKLKDFSEKKIIGLNKKETSTYEISIRNKKKQEIEIQIEDQIPLSSNNEITVETQETGGADLNKETGKLSWKLKIASAETKKMRFGYSVKYPKDKVIPNL